MAKKRSDKPGMSWIEKNFHKLALLEPDDGAFATSEKLQKSRPPPGTRLWPTTGAGEQSVSVRWFPWRFRKWAGAPVNEARSWRVSHGLKPLIDSQGSPKFAELAVIEVLKKQGFDGAAWVDDWKECFRDAMPPAKCELPAEVKAVYDRIASLYGKPWSGCWDVIAWNRDGISFVECKRKGKDGMQPSQWKWRESALKAGVQPENFFILEWELE